MAVLNWKDVEFNPINVGQGQLATAGLFNEGLDAFSTAIKNAEARQEKTAGVAGVAKAMKLTTADAYRKAAANGELEINASNADFFANREKELLANEQAGVQTEGLKIDNKGKLILQEGYKIDNQGKLIDNKGKLILQEGYKIDNQGKIIDNEGKVITNQQSLFDLNKDKYELDVTKSQRAAQEKAAPVMAQISKFANDGTPEGRARANQLALDNAALFVQAGQTLADVEGISSGILTKIEAGIKANEGLVTAGVNAQKAKDDAAGLKIFQDVYNNNSFVNPEDAKKAIRDGPGTVEAKNKAISLIDANKDVMYHAVDAEKSLMDQSFKEGVKPQVAPNGGALFNLVTTTESGQKWDALFGQSQDKDSPFKDVDVTRMTIGDLDKMAPQYGKWVAERNNGVTATPMGMYQIVNSTLQQAAKELGLAPDTVFTADVQTKIFQHLVDKRILGPRPMQTKIDNLRQEWAGLKNVSDNQLAAAITAYEGGDRNALGAMLDPNATAAQAAQNDPAVIENGLLAAAKTDQPLNAQMNQALFDVAKQRDAYAAQLAQQMTLDTSFGGDKAAVLQELLNPTPVGVGQRGKMVKDAFNEVSPDVPDTAAEEDKSKSLATFDNEVLRVQEAYHLTAPQAIALVKGATAQSSWYEFWKGNQYTNQKKVDEYIGSMLDLKEKDPQKRMAGAIAELQAQAAKTSNAKNLQTLQTQYQEAMVDYYGAAERKRAGQPVNDKLALQRVISIGQRLEAEMNRIRTAASTTANIAAVPEQ
jgi:hypothetical protein